MAADADSGHVVLEPYASRRPRHGLVTASGWAALATSAVAIWVATQLGTVAAGWRPWLPWLPWLACVLPPTAAGVLCLVRRRAATSTATAAVFASCAGAGAYALGLPAGHHGLVLAASVLLLVCAGVAVVISGLITAVMISMAGAVSARRVALWTGAALVLTAVSIPSPVYVTGSPIQTVVSGNTGGEDALTVSAMLLLAVPLVLIGLAPARMATSMVVAWLPVAAAPLLAWDAFRLSILHLDEWYYVSWLVWLAVAVLALTEARRRRAA
jgi:hypothetical protein